MKRPLMYVSALLLVLIAAAVSAQAIQEPEAQNQSQRNRQPMMGQRMGMGMMNRMQGGGMGMGMMNGMQGRGTGMMNRGGTPGVTMPGGMRAGGYGTGNGPLADGGNLYLNMREDLGLDDGQVEKLTQIRIDLVQTTGDLETDLRVARIELQGLLDAEKPDMKSIEKSIDTVYELEAKLETARLRARFDAQAVLTPEQLEQVQPGTRGRGMMRVTRSGGRG